MVSGKVPKKDHESFKVFRKVNSYRDHAGNYITKTGYKIDDYALAKAREPAKEPMGNELKADRNNSILRGLSRSEL